MGALCYTCGAEQPGRTAAFCVMCGRALAAPPDLIQFGRRYLVNRLDDLVSAGVIDHAAARRARATILGELAGASPQWQPPRIRAAPPVPDVAARAMTNRPTAQARPPIAADSPAEVAPAVVETFFTPERAPSLLLYLGAFLVVVAALIFVNVSGQQISDPMRLVLMISGTLGFLAAGLVCHRIPRVEEAGHTFLIVGALLVPLDFIAYYALVVRVSPLTSPAMWVLGSAVAAGLYGALAVRSYGRAYSYLFFLAALSACAGLEQWAGVPRSWSGVPFVLLALALDVDDSLGRAHLASKLTAPLELPASVLAAVSLVVGSFAAMTLSQDFSHRLALPVLALLGTVYYARRAAREIPWERWLVSAGPAAIALAVIYAARGPAQTYGFTLAVLAVFYTLAREIEDLGAQPTPLPAWARERARSLSYAFIAGALLPVTAYWRAPLVGATVYILLCLLLALLAIRRARSGEARSGRVEDLGGFVLIAAGAAHVGVVFLLVALGVLRAGVAPFSELVDRDLAIAFAPLALVLG